ncbi:hypothetical protein [Nonlabens sp. MIC269]|nr:hypothetical protein [Nonlabens sp. MIC269]
MVPVVIGAIFLSYTARDIVRARLDEQGSKLDEEMHKPSDKWI